MAQVQAPVNQLGQAEMQAQGGRKDQSGIGHQAVVVEGDLVRSRWLRGSIYWVLLVWGRFCVSKTIIVDAQENPSHSSVR